VIAIAAIAGCRGSPAPTPTPQDSQRYVLAADGVGTGQGFAVDTGTVVAAGADAGAADFWLRVSTVVSLTALNPNQPFCGQGGPFAAVAEIPTDASACAWTYVDLGGNSSFANDGRAGQGFLVKDGGGAIAARLLIVTHHVDETGHVEVAFDLARL